MKGQRGPAGASSSGVSKEMKHELQHIDSPTWCVHCGTFDMYCKDTKCQGKRTRAFDSSIAENRERVFFDIFGIPLSFFVVVPNPVEIARLDTDSE